MLNDTPTGRYAWNALLSSQRILSGPTCKFLDESALAAFPGSGSIQMFVNQSPQPKRLHYCCHLMSMAVPAGFFLISDGYHSARWEKAVMQAATPLRR